MYVKCEFFNPLTSVKDRLAIAHYRGRRTHRQAQTRPDGRRGHLGQHRHRARHGVRRQGLSLCRHHGGDLLHRAPQDHAHARRQGDPHAGRRARHRHGEEGGGARARSTAGSSRASSRIRPTPPTTATPPDRKSSQDFAGKRLDFFVTGWGTGGTLTGVGEMIKLARPGREDHRHRARGGVAALRASPSRRTRSRAGRRTSCPRCSTARSPIASSPSPMPRPSRPRARWRSSEGIFCGISSGGDRSPRRSRSRARRPPGSVILAMLPDTGERYLSTRALRRHRRRQRSGALNAATRAAELAQHRRRMDARHFAALPDPFPMWRGGTLHGGAHRLRDLGRAQRGARQRATAVYRPVAVRARGLLPRGSERRLVGEHGRARAGHRHEPFLRHVREFARQLFRLHAARPRSIRPPGAPTAWISRISRSRTSRAPASRRCARSASSALDTVIGPSLGGMVVLAFRGAVPGRRAPPGQHLRHRGGLAVCDRAALDAARSDPARSGLEGRRL